MKRHRPPTQASSVAVRLDEFATLIRPHFDTLIWPHLAARDDKIPGWTGGAKWSYSKRSGAGELRERRSVS